MLGVTCIYKREILNSQRSRILSSIFVTKRYMSRTNSIEPTPFIVSTAWLSENLSNVIPIDATWFMPGVERDAYQEYLKTHIPNSRFFPIETVKDTKNSLPHMLPTKEFFSEYVGSKLGVSKDSHVVVYDSHGIFSSPRALWTFKVFGHERISVLDGGLPKWTAEKREITLEKTKIIPTTYEVSDIDFNLVRNYEQIRKNAQIGPSCSKFEIVMDARSKERFTGQAPEPRPQIPSGHIPHSISLPFQQLFTQTKPITFLPPNELRRIFADHGIRGENNHDNDTTTTRTNLVASCGSGLTACIIWLAARIAGIQANVAVYDGSWTEWAEKEKDKGDEALIERG